MSSMADNRKKEPTNQDIIDALKKSRTITLAALFCSVAIAGLILSLNASSQKAQIYGWSLFVIAGVFFVVNFLARNK